MLGSTVVACCSTDLTTSLDLVEALSEEAFEVTDFEFFQVVVVEREEEEESFVTRAEDLTRLAARSDLFEVLAERF